MVLKLVLLAATLLSRCEVEAYSEMYEFFTADGIPMAQLLDYTQEGNSAFTTPLRDASATCLKDTNKLQELCTCAMAFEYKGKKIGDHAVCDGIKAHYKSPLSAGSTFGAYEGSGKVQKLYEDWCAPATLGADVSLDQAADYKCVLDGLCAGLQAGINCVKQVCGSVPQSVQNVCSAMSNPTFPSTGLVNDVHPLSSVQNPPAITCTVECAGSTTQTTTTLGGSATGVDTSATSSTSINAQASFLTALAPLLLLTPAVGISI